MTFVEHNAKRRSLEGLARKLYQAKAGNHSLVKKCREVRCAYAVAVFARDTDKADRLFNDYCRLHDEIKEAAKKADLTSDEIISVMDYIGV